MDEMKERVINLEKENLELKKKLKYLETKESPILRCVDAVEIKIQTLEELRQVVLVCKNIVPQNTLIYERLTKLEKMN